MRDGRPGMFSHSLRLACIGVLAAGIVGCKKQAAERPPEARPVAVHTVEADILVAVTRLSGEVRAQTEVELGFRIGGKVVERGVDVGAAVSAGQVVARLDPELERNALVAAKAKRVAAEGEVEQLRRAYERQEVLMRQGFTTRPRYEQALTAYEVSRASLDEAETQVALAEDRLGFTELRADAPGVVTARNLEIGEVVQPGQTVLRLARDDGRDAVFDVAAQLLDRWPPDGRVRVALASDPAVQAAGSIREIAAQADAATGTFRVRVGLDRPPAAMQLGSTVLGSFEKGSTSVVSVPAGALTIVGAAPAVWVVDPATSRVAPRRIEILRFEEKRVVVGQGLAPGDVVVAAGVQALHPGQLVAPLKPVRQASGLRPALSFSSNATPPGEIDG